jgi:hypothetical protein
MRMSVIKQPPENDHTKIEVTLPLPSSGNTRSKPPGAGVSEIGRMRTDLGLNQSSHCKRRPA